MKQPLSTAGADAPAADSWTDWLVPLPRVATVEQWLAGRAGRRKLCERFNGNRPLRRIEGDPRKDRVLRQLNDGERGARFITTAELEQTSLRAMETLRNQRG